MYRFILFSFIILIFAPCINTAKSKSIFPPIHRPEEKKVHPEHKRNVREFQNTINNLPKYSKAWRKQKRNLERKLKTLYKVNSEEELPDHYYYPVNRKATFGKRHTNNNKTTNPINSAASNSGITIQQIALQISGNSL